MSRDPAYTAPRPAGSRSPVGRRGARQFRASGRPSAVRRRAAGRPAAAPPGTSAVRVAGADAAAVEPGTDRRALGREASGFMAAGAVGLLIDIGGYNALVHLGSDGLLDDQPLVAKTISLVAGTSVAYLGNRFWTYRDRPRGRVLREYSLYMAFSAVALVISLVCLAASRYVLGLSSPVADNVAANVVGLALGSLFRFLTYRRYVFPEQPAT